MKLSLIRHGVTTWNLEKRIQGWNDQPLSACGRDRLAALALPLAYHDYRWYCSPLLRARQTAQLLGLQSVEIEPSLIEMNWGEWEGQILKPLRRREGENMCINESRGVDFCPPGGESPRQVQGRLQPWLQRIAALGTDCAAVTHQGIIRSVYALASGWDMRGEAPVNFIWDGLHQFELTAEGKLLESYRCIPLTEKCNGDKKFTNKSLK